MVISILWHWAWALMNTAWAPKHLLQCGLNAIWSTWKSLVKIPGSLLDALSNPMKKESWKNILQSQKQIWKNEFFEKQSSNFKNYISAFKDNSKLSQISKIAPGAVYWIWTALDATWRWLATPFVWAFNLFRNRENKVNLRNWFKNNQQNWRWSLKENGEDQTSIEEILTENEINNADTATNDAEPENNPNENHQNQETNTNETTPENSPTNQNPTA